MASNDTFSGALEVLAKQISTMMGLADADLPFCIQLLEQVTSKRRSPEMAMQQAGLLPQGSQNPMGLDALGLNPGAGGPPGMGAGTQMGGGMNAPPPGMGPGPQPGPSPDELAMLLGGV